MHLLKSWGGWTSRLKATESPPMADFLLTQIAYKLIPSPLSPNAIKSDSPLTRSLSSPGFSVAHCIRMIRCSLLKDLNIFILSCGLSKRLLNYQAQSVVLEWCTTWLMWSVSGGNTVLIDMPYVWIVIKPYVELTQHMQSSFSVWQ